MMVTPEVQFPAQPDSPAKTIGARLTGTLDLLFCGMLDGKRDRQLSDGPVLTVIEGSIDTGTALRTRVGMSGIEALVQAARHQAREKRATLFREMFEIRSGAKILDIGSENGSAIAAVLRGTPAQPKNIYIADIDAARVEEGRARFGFMPVVIPESGRLPFEDGFFDIVYCSSVIEHVTVPKEEVWAVRSGSEFRRRARSSQRQLADEIRRVGKAYYVQTPDKWFPIESHTWLPFIGYVPRTLQMRLIWFSNRYWVKRTDPDWCLLTIREMREFFPEAEVRRERFLGLPKSIMAIKK